MPTTLTLTIGILSAWPHTKMTAILDLVFQMFGNYLDRETPFTTFFRDSKCKLQQNLCTRNATYNSRLSHAEDAGTQLCRLIRGTTF